MPPRCLIHTGSFASRRPPEAQRVRAVVPAGATAGSVFRVAVPGNSTLQVTTPPGALPGTTVELSAPTPVDTTGSGIVDAVGYDTTGDGCIDALDTTMDGRIDTRLDQLHAHAPPQLQPPHAPSRQRCAVTVPAGVFAGGSFQVHAPDGTLMLVRVPPGASAGSVIHVDLPAPPRPAPQPQPWHQPHPAQAAPPGPMAVRASYSSSGRDSQGELVDTTGDGVADSFGFDTTGNGCVDLAYGEGGRVVRIATLEVVLPVGALPGGTMLVHAPHGATYTVLLPPNAVAGKRMRMHAPMHDTRPTEAPAEGVARTGGSEAGGAGPSTASEADVGEMHAPSVEADGVEVNDTPDDGDLLVAMGKLVAEADAGIARAGLARRDASPSKSRVAAIQLSRRSRLAQVARASSARAQDTSTSTRRARVAASSSTGRSASRADSRQGRRRD